MKMSINKTKSICLYYAIMGLTYNFTVKYAAFQMFHLFYQTSVVPAKNHP